MKKLIALLLTVCLLAACLPLSASAENETSGTCGENVTWDYESSTGTLVISGYGKMDDYGDQYPKDRTPWGNFNDSILSVVFSSGIENTGKNMFRNLHSQRQIVISETISEINLPYGATPFLSRIDVSDNNPEYKSENGVLFSKDGTKLVYFPRGIEGPYEIPGEVTEICEKAFFFSEISAVDNSLCKR